MMFALVTFFFALFVFAGVVVITRCLIADYRSYRHGSRLPGMVVAAGRAAKSQPQG